MPLSYVPSERTNPFDEIVAPHALTFALDVLTYLHAAVRIDFGPHPDLLSAPVDLVRCLLGH
jgi:hypothetical protein